MMIDLCVYMQHWSTLDHSKGEPWPVERAYHAATILNYGQDFPQLLVIGGYSGGGSLSDVWTLDLQSEKWKEVKVLDRNMLI